MSKIPFGAAKMVDSSDQIRATKCLEAIQYTLNKYDCVIVPHVQIVGNTIRSNWSVAAKPRKVIKGNGN